MAWFSLLICIPCLPLFFPKDRIAFTVSCAHVCARVCALFVVLQCPTHPHHRQYPCFYPVEEIFYRIPFYPAIVLLKGKKKKRNKEKERELVAYLGTSANRSYSVYQERENGNNQ